MEGRRGGEERENGRGVKMKRCRFLSTACAHSYPIISSELFPEVYDLLRHSKVACCTLNPSVTTSFLNFGQRISSCPGSFPLTPIEREWILARSPPCSLLGEFAGSEGGTFEEERWRVEEEGGEALG